MSEELYHQPTHEISQGDILDIVPHIYLDPPLLALRSEAMDLFRAFGDPYDAFDDQKGQPVLAHCKRIRAIVLTHDCIIDKKNAERWHISPILPLHALSSAVQGDVKRNRVYSRLFLPRFREILPDSFVDFNQISTVSANFVRSAARLVSLSDFGRHALYAQFIRWFTRWELREIECPQCQTSFNPTLSLPVRPA